MRRVIGITPLLFACLAGSAGGQALTDRILAVREGTVRLSYGVREGICGDGESFIRDRSRGEDNVTTFEVKVSIDNPGNELKANMTANAEIVLEEFPNSLIVPEAAISYDAQRNPTVEVVDDKADKGRRKVSIKTGVGNGTRTQVLDGLKQGDKVVLPS